MLEWLKERRWISAVIEAARGFEAERGPRMAAAISYRTFFALAPLVLIATAVFAFVVGGSAEARAEVLQAIRRVAGQEVASAVDSLIVQAFEASGITALVGIVLFLWTSSTLFFELQTSLNDMFDVDDEEAGGVRGFIRKRLIGVLWVLGMGLLVALVWSLNAAWEWLSGLFPENLGVLRQVMGWAAPLLSLLVVPFVFVIAFKTLTRADISFKALWQGGLFTSAVFLLTALGARVYFNWGDTAGQVVGAVFVILLISFMLSAAFLFGARLTRVLDERESVEADEPDARIT